MDNSLVETLPKRNIPSGFLLIDKKEGPTSHDVVQKARDILGIKRIGHAGTLDPFASGLLILCIGPATRVSEYLMKKEKSYIFTLILGATSNTYDRTGEIVPMKSIKRGKREIVEENALQKVLKEFTGTIEQIPPAFSAVKKKGRKLYEYARKGEKVEANPRIITVYSLSLLNYQYPEVELEAKVGSGTYIRSLGHDIGQRLETGAYVESLRRTSTGFLNVNNAFSIDSFQGKKELMKHLIGIKEMFKEWPRISVTGSLLDRIRNGNSISSRGIYSGPNKEQEIVLILDSKHRELCMAILKKEENEWMIQPKRMLTTPQGIKNRARQKSPGEKFPLQKSED